MKALLRRYLLILALTCVASLCIGCDEDEEDGGMLPLLGRAWMPAPKPIVVTPASTGATAGTPSGAAGQVLP